MFRRLYFCFLFVRKITCTLHVSSEKYTVQCTQIALNVRHKTFLNRVFHYSFFHSFSEHTHSPIQRRAHSHPTRVEMLRLRLFFHLNLLLILATNPIDLHTLLKASKLIFTFCCSVNNPIYFGSLHYRDIQIK